MLHNLEVFAPEEIEKRSFEIIDTYIDKSTIDTEFLPILKRVIHTTADFEYVDILKRSSGFIQSISQAIREGATIVTDTRMAWSGINKKGLEKWNSKVLCFMDDAEVAKEASQRNITRATVCMERASKIDGNVVVVVGNAPTALIRLYEMQQQGLFTPKAIVGVPVGFVNVVEAKELIAKAEIPYIISEGRKGGSNVAAAIVNAVVKELK